METLTTEVLVVGGGTGGVAAAIQAARRGANTIVVSEFSWLGGMLTSAGVSAPDGNELIAFQTGIWGAFLRQLQQRQPEGLDHGWVSFFTYDPRVGAEIFADWVAELSNLHWIAGQVPLEVLRQGDRVTGVRFADFTIHAQIVLDGTELGDLLALADVPHRWGWEWHSEFGEPSAPAAPTALTQRYPVQSPTWVVVMQDFGIGSAAPTIPAPPNYDRTQFVGAWDTYGGEAFLNYGRLPGNRFMINWPIRGNDYGEGLERLLSADARQKFLQESLWHTQGFAHFIQAELDRRYGLAEGIFPISNGNQPSVSAVGAYALHPYYRESRRLQGLTTVREQDILPIAQGCVAPLPISLSAQGCLEVETHCDAIAIGNYANDHHYPSDTLELKPKSIRWGGRWTGTPFTIPYRCLIPAATEGLLVCEKNISVTHIANGATRLQPLVLGIGQAAGMAAALCVEQGCQPRDLAARSLQDALLQDPTAPAAVIPLFNLPPDHPDWLFWQRYYLEHPEAYPSRGNAPISELAQATTHVNPQHQSVRGRFQRHGSQEYQLQVTEPASIGDVIQLVTLHPELDRQLANTPTDQPMRVIGKLNRSGNWLLVDAITTV